jgi:hypothetical protein
LTAPVDVLVHGESELARSRVDATAGLLFEPIERQAIEATEAVRRVASGGCFWWSSWYEEGSHFSAVVRDGDIVHSAEQPIVEDNDHRVAGCRLLPAYVDIMLAAGEVRAAHAAVEELQVAADDLGAPSLRAAAVHRLGSVMLAEGDGDAALRTLRIACEQWQSLDAPYEAARARVTMGQAWPAAGRRAGRPAGA